MVGRWLVVGIGVAFCAAARPVRADVDVELVNGDRVTGTLAPATEVETFRFTVPRDAVLTVQAKSAKKGPELSVVLRDASSGQVAANVGRAVKLTQLTVPSSQEYRLEITSSDGLPGDYALSVKWKSARALQGTFTLPPGMQNSFLFGAEALARATITVTPDDPSLQTSLVLPDLSETAIPARGSVLSQTGEYGIEVGNPGVTPVTVTATVRLVPPKPSKRKFALTTKSIGASAFARSLVLGPDGGTVTLPELPEGSPGQILAGSAVTIPAGALPSSVAILIATATPIDPPGDFQLAGPTVLFGPEGVRFDTVNRGTTASVTIPFDPAFAGETNEFLIYTRDAKGRLTLVPPPYTFDGSTVTFATSHFSSFAVVLPQSTPTGTSFVALASVTDPLDVAFYTGSENSGSTEPIFLLVAEGFTKNVGSIRIGSTGFTHAVFAGGGTQTADGTYRTNFQFADDVTALSPDFSGNTYVATRTQVFKVDDTGAVTRVAGTGTVGTSGDNGAAVDATFSSIHALLFVDATSELFVADETAHTIRRITTSDGTITRYAGDGTAGAGADDIDPLTTQFVGPYHMISTVDGGLYVADGGRVREIQGGSSFVNATVAGDPLGSTGNTGDGLDPILARFSRITGISQDIDPQNPTAIRFVVSDTSDHTIRLVDLTARTVRLVAGRHGTPGYGGDFTVLPGFLNRPSGLLDLGGSLYLCDRGNQKVRVTSVPVP